MPQVFDPSAPVAQVIYPRPVTGFRRMVQVSHPLCGTGTLLSTEASFNDSGSPNYTKYAYTPGMGPHQKAIHSAGTREVTWTVGGDITSATLGLLALLTGSARGVNFSQLLISQGDASYFFDNQDGVSLPWGQFSVSGNPGAGLSFSLEGRTTVEPSFAAPLGPVVVSPQVPSWSTGNDLVLSWSLSHNVNLQPRWFNQPYVLPSGQSIGGNGGGMLPAYYRALDSEFTLQVTTAVALANYTAIVIGFGGVTYAEMIVTSENVTYGDRNSPVTYQVSSTNAAILNQADAYNEFVTITLNGSPDAGYG